MSKFPLCSIFYHVCSTINRSLYMSNFAGGECQALRKSVKICNRPLMLCQKVSMLFVLYCFISLHGKYYVVKESMKWNKLSCAHCKKIVMSENQSVPIIIPSHITPCDTFTPVLSVSYVFKPLNVGLSNLHIRGHPNRTRFLISFGYSIVKCCL